MTVPKNSPATNRHGKSILLVIIPLFLLLASIFCSARLSLMAVRPDRLDVVVKPQATADYRPWAWEQFKPVDPALSTLVVQEQATLVSETEGPGVAVAAAISPTSTPSTPDFITSIAPTFTITAQVTATPQASRTAEATLTPMPTSTVTNIVLPTETLTSTGAATATSTITTTNTASFTPTATPTLSPTYTLIPSPTSTVTSSPLPSWTPVALPTQTLASVPAPVAGLSANPLTGQAPLGVTFISTSTGVITAYSWSFGDGMGFSQQANAYYVYATPGMYSIQLTVYGPGGASSATGLINVLPPPTPVPSPTYTPAPTNTPIPPRADLAVRLTVNNSTPNEGDTIIFTVTVRNRGPNRDNGIQVSDSLPAGLSLIDSSTSQGIYAGGVWTIGTLASRATATLTLTAQVEAGTGGSTLTNTATLTAASLPDPVAGNNTTSASVTVQVSAAADLSVNKTVDNSTPNEGDTITFTVTITNNGPNTDDAILVSDSLPAGLNLIGGIASQGSYVGGVWTVGTLASGTTATLALTAQVGVGTGGSTLINTATFTAASLPDPVPGNDTASASVTVQASADLAVSKTVDNGIPNEGDTVTFTVTITNNSPNTDDAILVSDSLPAGLNLIGGIASQGSYAGGVWTVGTLASGATATLALTAQVGAGTGGSTLINTATLTAASLPDPVPGNDTASVSMTVRASADLAVSKTVDNSTPNEGDTVTFTVTITNNSPNTDDGIQVSDSLPAGLNLIGGIASQGSYVGGVWTVGTLTSGATATLALTAQVGAGTGGSTLINTATLTAASLPDLIPGNNAASASVTVQASADLAVNKIVDNGTPNEGDNITFTVMVTNNGPNTDDGIQVSDSLPAGLNLIGSSASQGSYAGGIWTVGTLTSGATATLTVTVQVGAGARGSTLTNTATLTAASQPDLIPGNNSASASVTVQGSANSDLAVNKTVDNRTPRVGDIVTFTVTVTNYGPGPNYGVQINDILQPGLWETGTSVSQGSYIGGVWTVGTLTSGATATLTLTAQVGVGTGGSRLTNLAFIITMSAPDPNFINNSDFASVWVQSVGMNPPVANDDTSLTSSGTPVTIDVLANDTDPDGNINPASVSITSNPPGGVIQSVNGLTGAITYQPNIGYVGIDLFGYQVCDTTGLCASAFVRVNIALGEVIIIDNADSTGVTITGAWSSSVVPTQYWASDYLHDQNTDKGTKSVTFTPNLAGGTYEVYMWWPADPQNASNAVAEIHYASGVTTVSVNQRSNGGQWNALGALQFNAGMGGFVVIQTTGTDGYVIADAVRFVKVGP